MVRTILQYFLALIAGLLCVFYVFSIYEGFIHRADFLYWDPASHAFEGVRLTAAIESLNPIKVLQITNEQTLWPPLHSYLQVPFMIVLGKNFFASSICSFSFLILLFLAATYCYRQVSNDWIGLLFLFVLIASSAYYLGYSTMPMHEIFGLTFVILCAALYLKRSRYLPIGLVLLFFFKYNYFLYIATPIAIIEISPWLLSLKHKTRKQIVALFTPFHVFVALYFVFVMIILATGGFRIGMISVRGIGNPLYVLFVIILLRTVLTGRHKRIWGEIQGSLWPYFILPVLIWLLIPAPNRIKSLVSFFINVPLSGHSPTQISYYTFYFEQLPKFFPSMLVFAFVVCLAGVYIVIHWRKKNTRFVLLAFTIPFVLMSLNQNKQDRYLFTFVIFLQLLAAWKVGNIRNTWMRLLLVLVLSVSAVYGYDENATKEIIAWPFVPSEVDEKVQFISENAIQAKEITFLGVSNEMSPSLLCYHILKIRNFHGEIECRWRLTKTLPLKSHLVVITPPADNKLISKYNQKPINTKAFRDAKKIDYYIVGE